MSIQVITPGALTTVQDLGRIGYQAFGVPVSGAMDPRALRLANILCGNPENEAALECTLLGPALRFTADNVIGLTGGDLGATLDGQPLAPYGAYAVKSGQTLRFTAPKTGCRAYLAFHGGLDIPLVMGSRSTYLKAKLGGFCGRKLEKDDEIAFRAPAATIPNLDARRFTPEFVKRDIYTLRVVLGPQDDAFTAEGLKTFLSEVYTVTPEFDRMGCRLTGAAISHKDGADIISDGIAFGAIQVPASGEPIIMLADRQTTGGYTKIANVISADFRLLAQIKANDRVRFEKVSIEAAQDARRAENNALRVFSYAFTR